MVREPLIVVGAVADGEGREKLGVRNGVNWGISDFEFGIKKTIKGGLRSRRRGRLRHEGKGEIASPLRSSR